MNTTIRHNSLMDIADRAVSRASAERSAAYRRFLATRSSEDETVFLQKDKAYNKAKKDRDSVRSSKKFMRGAL